MLHRPDGPIAEGSNPVADSPEVTDPHPCPFCGAPCAHFARAVVFGRHEATYVRCGRCNSVHIPDPYWLDEAYADAIAATDIGLPSRSVWTSQMTALVIRLFFPRATKFCDHGGGNGLFVRLMRDAGYDFRWRDPYATNEFARGFEAAPLDQFDLTTAFEVLEHLRDPHVLLDEVLARSPALLLTTELLPDDTPMPDAWWYYSLATGQHISFPTQAGLHALAATRGLQVTSAGEVHLLAPKRVSPRLLMLAKSRPASRMAAGWTARPSLLSADYETVVEATMQGRARSLR
jgi:hypothetical protein